MLTALQTLSQEMADVTAGVRRSLVHLQSGSWGAGAGTIWHPDGLIVTNAHVVAGGEPTVTLPNGREVPGRVLAHDSRLDLAALAVEANNLPTITLGDSRRLRSGQLVIAAGHPWGVLGAVASGVVIGLGGHPQDEAPRGREWVLAGLRLRPGHSGGPMTDYGGHLVGINTMMAGPEVAMAVPIHVAKSFLSEALRPEKSRH